MSAPAKTEGTGFRYFDVLDPEKKITMFTPQAAKEQREIEEAWDKQLRYIQREVHEVEEKCRICSEFVSECFRGLCLQRAFTLPQYEVVLARVAETHNHKFGYALMEEIHKFCLHSFYQYLDECLPAQFDYVMPLRFYEPLFPFRYQLASASLSQQANRFFHMLWSLQEHSWCSTETIPYSLSTETQKTIRTAAGIISKYPSKLLKVFNEAIDDLLKQSGRDAPEFPESDFSEVKMLVYDWQESESFAEEILNLPKLVVEKHASILNLSPSAPETEYACLFKDDTLVVHICRFPSRNTQGCWRHNGFDYWFWYQHVPSGDLCKHKLTPINHDQVLTSELQEEVESMRYDGPLAVFSTQSLEQLESIFTEQQKMLAGRKEQAA